MMKKSLRLFATFLISFILFPLTLPHGNSCAWWEPDDIIDVSVFIPELISDARYDAFFLSIWDYYYEKDNVKYPGRNYPEGYSLNDINLAEWKKYWRGADEGAINMLVYDLTEQQVDSVSTCVRVGKLLDGTLESLGSDKSKLAAFEYLKLAKQIQAATELNRYNWNWEENNAKFDQQHISKLAEQARIRYKSAKDPFLKMRYGFQYVRACYASGQYLKAVDFAQNEFGYSASDGSMYYRTHGYEAAALCKLGRFSEANVWYARMYDAHEAFRLSAFESFHPQEEVEWNQTIAKATSTRDKELLWHLLGVYADPVHSMNELAAINPQSDLLPLLLVRAVNIAERNCVNNVSYPGQDFGFGFEYDSTHFTVDPYYSWNSVKRNNLNELNQTIANISDLRQNDKAVWLMAQAFVAWLQGDVNACLTSTEEAVELDGENPMIRAQAAIHRLISRRDDLQQLDAAAEQVILSLIQGLNPSGFVATRSQNAERMVLRAMRNQYLKLGNPLRAELAEPNPQEFYAKAEQIQEMIDFMLRKDHTPFERFVLGKYPLKLEELYDVQAVAKMYAGDFEGAKDVYAKHPAAGNDELMGNPFNIRIVDCHDCDHAKPLKVPYTKRKFADKILEMKAKANDPALDAKERATNYFLMANGLYNMTWYGNARLLSVTVVNWNMSYSERFSPYTTKETEEPIDGYFDSKPALEAYLKAYELSNDTEFKAKCIWMAAKCEHNIWLETEYGEESTGDFKSGDYFRKLKQEYSTSQYYKQVIAECGYFCQFITPGNQSCIKNKE
jgi:hypothetical protein